MPPPANAQTSNVYVPAAGLVNVMVSPSPSVPASLSVTVPSGAVMDRIGSVSGSALAMTASAETRTVS